MRRNFAKLKNLSKSNMIKDLVSKTEGPFIAKSLFKFTLNFFEAIDMIKFNGIENELLRSDISLEYFIDRCVTKEAIKSILKHEDSLNPLQIKYFESLENLNLEYFNDLYSGPLKAAYKEYGYLYRPTLTKKERREIR